jgi:hypothetical protein
VNDEILKEICCDAYPFGLLAVNRKEDELKGDKVVGEQLVQEEAVLMKWVSVGTSICTRKLVA